MQSVLADLQQRPPKQPKLPSLDEWVDAEGLDKDFFTEAELLAEYSAAHGINNAEAAAAAYEAGWHDEAGRAVKALNLAERRITKQG